jgi:uncharacterized membrane protein
MAKKLPKIMLRDNHHRSLSKAITFRAIVVLVDIIVIFAITKQVGETVALIIYTNLVGTLLYYAHERYWERIKWGRLKLGKKL